MSRGTKLQKMEEEVKQSKTAVNANAKPGDPLPKGPQGSTPQGLVPVEDLGGPTPENYKVDDDSAKLKVPGGTLKQVSDVVTNRKGKVGAMPMKSGDEVELEADQEVVSEEPTKEEEVVAEVTEEETTSEINIEDDVNALLSGEDLSEEFKAKAKTIFEAALNSKVVEVKDALEEQFAAQLEERVLEEKTSLSERVDSYLEYVADEWFTENQLAVEGGLKEELTESFLSGMKNLFEEHYVSIPEEKYDVLESMVEKLDDMESKLNEQIEKNIGLNKRLAESVADGILESVSDGLASTQKEKLASLSESVEFASEQEYREKLEVLKESYFPGNAPATKSETLSEGVDNSEGATSHSASMDAYLKTMAGFKK